MGTEELEVLVEEEGGKHILKASMALAVETMTTLMAELSVAALSAATEASVTIAAAV